MKLRLFDIAGNLHTNLVIVRPTDTKHRYLAYVRKLMYDEVNFTPWILTNMPQVSEYGKVATIVWV
jgi:hypothetical protein